MVWLVGSRGMLGAEVGRRLAEERIPHVGSGTSVDVSRPQELEAFLRDRGIRSLDWIVNCAAYTAVDRAEDERAAAWAVNAEGPRNLARLADRTGAALLHVSTDYVFDGARDSGAYTEDDPPAPLGAYGMSKLAGEREVRAALGRHVIIRTAWLYGRGGRNFVDTMLGLFRGRQCVDVVRDQVGTPTWTRDLARAILAVLKSSPGNPRGCWGTYHFANRGAVSRFDFARAIYEEARAAGLAPDGVLLHPVSAAEYPTRAPRPRNSALALEKISAAFPVAVRGWREALRDYIREGAEAA